MLKDEIFAAIEQAGTPEELEQLLKDKGIDVQFFREDDDKIFGWSVHEKGGGWIGAGSVDQGLGWQTVQQKMARRVPAPTTPEDMLSEGLNLIYDNWLQRLILEFVMMIMSFIEGLFNLPKGCLFGRFEPDPAGSNRPVVTPPEPLPVDAGAELEARLAKAREVMTQAVEKIVEAIKKGDLSLLPTLSDPAVQAARQAAIDHAEELQAEEEGDRYERPQG